MKAFFDTSVLVPVALGDHENHEACLDLFVRHTQADACCGAHSLAEVYAVLTKVHLQLAALRALRPGGAVPPQGALSPGTGWLYPGFRVARRMGRKRPGVRAA